MANKTKAQKEAEAAAKAAQTTPVGATSDAPQGGGQPTANPEEKPPTAPAKDPVKNEEAKPAAKKQVPSIGRTVIFYRAVNSGNGVKLLPHPAVILGDAAPASNLPADSLDLLVMSRTGVETRFGVLASDEPKANCWSWPVIK